MTIFWLVAAAIVAVAVMLAIWWAKVRLATRQEDAMIGAAKATITAAVGMPRRERLKPARMPEPPHPGRSIPQAPGVQDAHRARRLAEHFHGVHDRNPSGNCEICEKDFPELADRYGQDDVDLPRGA